MSWRGDAGAIRRSEKVIASTLDFAKFRFRQGLWTADLRTPPEQECSNGSLIRFAVVLWRTFFWLLTIQRIAGEAVSFPILETEGIGSSFPYKLQQTPVKLLKVKTTRFRVVVDTSGQPEIHTLWLKPNADRPFQAMLKNNRVMTIRASQTGTEFGVVGFHKDKTARYLTFPRSVKRFEGQRIVGIDWLLVKS